MSTKTSREKAIEAQLKRKFKKLAKLEQNQKFNNEDDHDFKVVRTIYAGVDGFAILRVFSKTEPSRFNLVVQAKRIDWILKRGLPYKSEDGRIWNLYELLKSSIGFKINVGSEIDIGSRGGGITFGDGFKINGFQLLVYKNEQIEDIAETLDDIKYVLYSQADINQLERENLLLKNKITELTKFNRPLIITEGKTDWKYFVRALDFYHKRNQFLSISKDWFLKFGSEQDKLNCHCDTDFVMDCSVSVLNTILDSFIETRSLESGSKNVIRIGIFDSDDKAAKSRDDKEHGVFSFLIEPNQISTELLFSEEEITYTFQNRRLYLGSEFDSKTCQLLTNRAVALGNDNSVRNKAGKRVIIDSNVYDREGVNIALPKDDFSSAVYHGNIEISENSWLRFKHIFDKIIDIIESR